MEDTTGARFGGLSIGHPHPRARIVVKKEEKKKKKKRGKKKREKNQILTNFVANLAETSPNFIGTSQITQKTLQNAENQKREHP